MKMRDYLRLTICLYATLIGAQITLAREITNTTDRLAPVVVTALPETTAVIPQTAPAAITQLDRADVEAAGIDAVEDLPGRAPNVSLSRSVSRSFGDIYTVRGVGNTQFFSSPALVLYVDDVPAGSVLAFPPELWGVERIDIWRGPQATAFGQNSPAGVINIVTRQPTDRWEAFGNASYATFNTQQYQAGAMGPLVKEKLYLTAGGGYARSDGFLHNPVLHNHPDHEAGFNAHTALRWIPAADWEVNLGGSYDDYDDGIRLTPLSGPFDQSPSDIRPSADSTLNTQALRISRLFSETLFTSITSRRDYELSPLFLDLDQSAIPGNTARITQDEPRWSQELRLQTLPDDGDWQWLGGFFFTTADRDGDDTRNYIVPVGGGVFLPVTSRTTSTLGDDTYALFGNATYSGLDPWEITGGLRLDYTVKRIDRKLDSNITAVPPVNDEQDYYNAAPKLTVGYRVTTNLLAFGSTGLGFKPGGFSAYSNPPLSPLFDTEYNWANEIGLKTTWLDERLLANVTLFYNFIHDYQVERTSTNLVDLTIVNADRVTSRGAELELIGRPVKGLELSVALGYTDCTFDRYRDPETGADRSGNHPPFVPEFTALLAAQYRHRWGLFARVEFEALGQTYFDEANTAAMEQDSYGLLDARFGYEAKHWSVCFFGTNLTDTKYYERKIADLQAGVPGRPQLVGVQASVRY